MANWLLHWSTSADAGEVSLVWRAAAGAAVRSPLSPKLACLGDLQVHNRRDLCARWGMANDASAASLILHAYQVSVHQGLSPGDAGRTVAESLVGDFSFALIDEERRGILLVRDPMAVRPLYVWSGAGEVAIGTGEGTAGDTWDGMLDCVCRLSEEGVGGLWMSDAVMGQWCVNGVARDERRTFVQGVHKLPRACVAWMSAESDGQPQPYWNASQVQPLLLKSEAEYVDALRSLLERSVKDRVTQGRRVAAHCSGGLDSTAIAVRAGRLARAAGQAEFRTYNWCEPPGADASALQAEAARHEWEDARRIANEEGFLHREVGLDADDVAAVLTTHDLVAEGTTPFLTAYESKVLRDARAGSVDLLLSGFGGDEILTERGKEWHVPAIRQGQWLAAWQAMRLEAHPDHWADRWKVPLRFARDIWRACRPDTPLTAPVAAEEPWGAVGEIWQPEWFEHHTASLYSATPLWRLHDRQIWRMASAYHQERMENWALHGDRLGVRYGFPQLDQRLVAFALALPSQWYFRHGESRYLYRRAAADVLPRWLLKKPKPPEMLRVRRVLQVQHEALMRPAVQDWIAASESNYVNTGGLLAACRRLKDLDLSARDMKHLQGARAQLKTLSTAVLALTTERAMVARQKAFGRGSSTRSTRASQQAA